MASEKQIQANRENALKSTGPKSPEGKRRAARNALKHGLLSQDMLLPGEKAKELNAFREGMFAELAPEGELEEFLADRVVESAWRLRRAVRMERDIIHDKEWREELSRARSPSAYLGDPPLTGGYVAAKTLCGSDTYDKLGRYETHIERGLYRALHELQRCQAARRGQQVTPPAALDVSVDVTGLPANAQETNSAKQSHSDGREDSPDGAEAPAGQELPDPDHGTDPDTPGSRDAS